MNQYLRDLEVAPPLDIRSPTGLFSRRTRLAFDILPHERDSTRRERVSIGLAIDPARLDFALPSVSALMKGEVLIAHVALSILQVTFPSNDISRPVFAASGLVSAIDPTQLVDRLEAPRQTVLFSARRRFLKARILDPDRVQAQQARASLVYLAQSDELVFPGGRFPCDPTGGFLRAFLPVAHGWSRRHWTPSRLVSALALVAAIEAGRDVTGPSTFGFTIGPASWAVDVLINGDLPSGIPDFRLGSVWNQLSQAGVIRDSAFHAVATPRPGPRYLEAIGVTTLALRRLALELVDYVLDQDPGQVQLWALTALLERFSPEQLAHHGFTTLLADHQSLSAHARLALHAPTRGLMRLLDALTTHPDMPGFLNGPMAGLIAGDTDRP